MRSHTLCFAFITLVAACGTPAEPADGSISSDDARERLAAANGRADGNQDEVAARLCTSHGEEADCDVCDLMAWYDDGTCDAFCEQPDGDCFEDDYVITFVQTTWVADRVDSLELRSGVLAGFDPGEFAASMRTFDADVRGCSERTYSRSRDDGIAKYRDFVETHEPYADVEFWADFLDRRIVRDENVAVFASVPAESADSESCDYHDFYGVDGNGQVTHFAFDFERDGDSGASPVSIRFPSAAAKDIHDVMNKYGHNGASGIGLWGRSALDYDELGAYVSEADANRRCTERIYSSSTEDAHEMFDGFNEGEFGIERWTRELEGEVSDEVRADASLIRDVVTDEDNVAVFASEFDWDGTDHSESCLYWDYYILRRGGDALRFRVELTD